MSTAVLSSPSELLSRDEAAAFLGIKSQTLSVWACTKRYRLPYVKIGSRVKYRRADLEAFLDRRTVNGEEQNQ